MIGLSYKQKCNNFGYLSNEVQSKGNDSYSDPHCPSSYHLIKILQIAGNLYARRFVCAQILSVLEHVLVSRPSLLHRGEQHQGRNRKGHGIRFFEI